MRVEGVAPFDVGPWHGPTHSGKYALNSSRTVDVHVITFGSRGLSNCWLASRGLRRLHPNRRIYAKRKSLNSGLSRLLTALYGRITPPCLATRLFSVVQAREHGRTCAADRAARAALRCGKRRSFYDSKRSWSGACCGNKEKPARHDTWRVKWT